MQGSYGNSSRNSKGIASERRRAYEGEIVKVSYKFQEEDLRETSERSKKQDIKCGGQRKAEERD